MCAGLEAQLAEMRGVASVSAMQASAQREVIEALESRLSESMQAHQEEQSGLEMSIRDLEDELGASKSTSKAQEDELGRLRGSVDALQSSLEQSQSELVAARHEYKQSEEAGAKLELDMKELEELLEGARQGSQVQQSEIVSLQASLSSTQAELKAAKQEHDQGEERIAGVCMELGDGTGSHACVQGWRHSLLRCVESPLCLHSRQPSMEKHWLRLPASLA